MAEFTVRLGTPAGEIVTRTVEAMAANEARTRLEREGFKVFAAQGATFPRIYTASILAGERSGALDEVLSRYVNYMRRSVGLRRKIRGALAYPTFLLFACLAMVIFLTTFVVPRMSELFAGFGNNLPTVTRIVLALSNWLTGNVYWFAPLLIIVVAGSFFWSRTPPGRLMIDAFMLRLR